MTVYREDNDIWDPDEVINDFMKVCPIVGFLGIDNVTLNSGSTSGEFPLDNLLNSFTHLRWRDDGDGRQVHLFQVDNLYFETNYIALAVHNLNGHLIKVLGATSDSPSDFVELFAEMQITNNGPLLLEFASGQYTSIQIRIDNTAADVGDDFKTIAIMHVGQLLRFGRGVKVDEHAVETRNKKVDSLAGYSEAGQYMGKLIRNEVKESKYDFSNITDEFMQDDFWLTFFLDQFAESEPFFIAWAPDDYPDDVIFGWSSADIAPTQNPITRRWSLSIPVRGYAQPRY